MNQFEQQAGILNAKVLEAKLSHVLQVTDVLPCNQVFATRGRSRSCPKKDRCLLSVYQINHSLRYFKCCHIYILIGERIRHHREALRSATATWQSYGWSSVRPPCAVILLASPSCSDLQDVPLLGPAHHMFFLILFFLTHRPPSALLPLHDLPQSSFPPLSSSQILSSASKNPPCV
jgi:hypothetical protein